MATSDVTNALVTVVKNVQPSPRFMLGLLFKKESVQDTKYIELQGQYAKARVAKFVNPEAVAKGTERLSFTRDNFILPTIQDRQPITQKDIEKIRLGDTEFTPSTPAEKLWAAIADTVSDQKNMVANRHEASAIEAAFSGTITVLGEGENRVIDFGRPAELTVDIGALDADLYFDGATPNPDKVITDGIKLLGSFGRVCDTVIGCNDVIAYIVENDNIKDKLDNRRIQVGGLTFENMLKENGVIYYGTYKNVDIYGYEGLDGAVPSNKLLFASSVNQNEMVNGYSPDMTSLLAEIGVNVPDSSRDNRNYITNLIAKEKTAEVEAIQTGSPLLADVYSCASFQVLA